MTKDEILGRLLRTARNVRGSRAQFVRDGILVVLGLATEAQFMVERQILRRRLPHPLGRLMLLRVADPMKRMNFGDVNVLREEFDEFLLYLPDDAGCTVRSESILVDGNQVELEWYSSEERSGQPIEGDSIVVYLHGGGFVLGEVSSNRPECGYLARNTGMTVLSVGYPLAPEHKWPQAVECVGSVIAELQSDRGPFEFYVVGESAGANVGAALCHRGELDQRLRPSGLVLVYPILDFELTGETMSSLATGYFATRSLIEWFRSQYVPEGVNLKEPTLSPLHGAFDKWPNVLLVAAEFDPLRSDCERLFMKLKGSYGRDVSLRVAPGMLHGFLQWRGMGVARRRELKRIAHSLRSWQCARAEARQDAVESGR